MFKKAERKQARLRLALAGPSGSGKTLSALLLATGLGGKIAVIDTEHESASLYAEYADFDVMSLGAPYSPERYIDAISSAEAGGYSVLIIDSYSHEWIGAGGCLEINDAIAKQKYKGNTWSAWNETTPRHRKLVDRILTSPLHIICTMRSKTETVQGEGKKIIKLGMKSEQREGSDYEFTVVLDLVHDGNECPNFVANFLQPWLKALFSGEDCKSCLLRRHGSKFSFCRHDDPSPHTSAAFVFNLISGDPVAQPHKLGCLRHRLWLYHAQVASYPLDHHQIIQCPRLVDVAGQGDQLRLAVCQRHAEVNNAQLTHVPAHCGADRLENLLQLLLGVVRLDLGALAVIDCGGKPGFQVQNQLGRPAKLFDALPFCLAVGSIKLFALDLGGGRGVGNRPKIGS